MGLGHFKFDRKRMKRMRMSDYMHSQSYVQAANSHPQIVEEAVCEKNEAK